MIWILWIPGFSFPSLKMDKGFSAEVVVIVEQVRQRGGHEEVWLFK